LVYVGLTLIWIGLSIRWRKELLNIQNCIAAVIMLGALEAFLWYVFYNNWNSQGVRGKSVFLLATLLTVVKSTFSYMLVLVASLGWGVTRPFLDRPVVLKIQVLSFFLHRAWFHPGDRPVLQSQPFTFAVICALVLVASLVARWGNLLLGLFCVVEPQENIERTWPD